MQHLPRLKPLLLVICLIAIGASSIAWYNQAGTTGAGNNTLDTLPKREKKVRAKTNKDNKTTINGDIDESLQELERASKELEEKLQGREWKKAKEQMAEAMEKLNAEKIQLEVQEALKNIEVDKIRLQAEMQLKQIDVQKMQKEIQKSLAEAMYNNVDSKKMEAEIQRAMEESRKAMSELKNVDMDKFKEELERSKEQLKKQQWQMKEEIENAKKNMKINMEKDLREELENAKEDIARAKEELQGYKSMLREMENEGLLSTKENYTVEYKDGELSINGKKQPDSVTDKYKHYFRKDNITIKHDKDDARTIRL